jgi:putative hydrolase of the HAD superfamily
MTLKAIAFDLWETLITNTEDVSEVHRRVRLERMERLLANQRFSGTAEQMAHAYRQSWNRCQELYWSRDKDVSCRTQIHHFLEALNLQPFDEPAMDALEHAYATVAVDFLPSIVPGADEVVPELERRGYRLGLISNTGRTPGSALRAILDRLGLLDHFDAMVFSNEHGECKPQRSIFEALRQSLGVGFDEMLFVGDNLYADVHGAQQCGMTAVHFIPPQRGTAVAPPVEHEMAIKPAATIRDLRELLPVIDAISASPDFEAAQTRRS